MGPNKLLYRDQDIRGIWGLFRSVGVY